MESEYIKYLEFIQNIITRMNKNSFQLKQWMVTIVSALLALYANSNNMLYIAIIIIPVIMFWCLDAYYLFQERRFRDLYNGVVKSLDKDTKNSEIKIFNMDIKKYREGKKYYIKTLFSITLVYLYLPIIVLDIIFLTCA